MSRAFALLLLLIPALAVPGEGAARERLDAIVATGLDRYGVTGLSVIVIEDCEVTARLHAGTANGVAPVGPATLYRTESLSKPVTAWGAVRLAEVGRIDLDAPVTVLAPGWTWPAGPHDLSGVSLRDLLTHSAGLPLGDFTRRFAPDANLPDLATELRAEAVPVAAPGRFAYSDTAYNLAELVLQDATGVDFAALMSWEVLGPLGMTDAAFGWRAATPDRIATGHDLRGDPVAAYVYPARASGGLIATPGDMAAFARAELDCGGLSNLSVPGRAALHAPAVEVSGVMRLVAPHYGLGHFVETLSDGRRSVWHGGQGYGWMSHLQVVPDSGSGIVILSNSQRAWPLFADVMGWWSGQIGVAPAGMARIAFVSKGIRIATVAALVLAALLLVRAGHGIRTGRRRLARPVAWTSPGLAAAMALAGWLGWSGTRDYLFLQSVVPHLYAGFRAALAVLAGTLLIAAVTPRTRGPDPMP